MADNLVDGVVMDIDLNQEPRESSGSSLNSSIEQRIHHLEVVGARAWQRHRWRQARNNEVQHQNYEEMNIGKGKGCKRDRSHLARALEISGRVVKKALENDARSGSFFDCNICLNIAKEPILTCCGHLYCWSCFYQLPYVDSTTKECPNCKGEVSDANITPIYGNGHGSNYCSKQVQFPPRPKAHRVESVRQQRVTRGLSHIPVAEALRRIRTSIGLGDHPPQLVTRGVSSTSVQELQNADATSNGGYGSRVFSRVLSESAASISSEFAASLSSDSELENAQRMFENLTASLTDRIHESGHVVAADEGNSFRRDAAIIRSERQTLDSIAATSSAASLPSSSQSNEVSDAALQLENLTTTDTGNLSVTRSSLSSSRRFIIFQ